MIIKTDFAEYKDSYKEEIQNSIAFSGQNVDFFTEIKARYLCEIARRHLGNPSKSCVLDVGCGVGLTAKFLATEFRALYGVDISASVIEKAALTNPSVSYQVYDGRRLPFPADSMDIVFTICVMHHITPAAWPNIIQELRRVTKTGGLVIVFEHNPYNPLTRRVVSNCIFDANAVLLNQKEVMDLFEQCELRLVEQRYILFFPLRGIVFKTLDRMLGWLPWGAQYYVAGRKI